MKFDFNKRVNATALREAIVLMHVGATTNERIIEIVGVLETDQILNHIQMREIPVRRFNLAAFATQSTASAEKEITRETKGQMGKAVFVFDGMGNCPEERQAAYQRCLDAALSEGHKAVTITYEDEVVGAA
jgi:hypothetical protein